MARPHKPSDPNGRHIRVYCSLLDTPAWRCLGWPARSLFIDMRARVGATNNGNISAALSDLKHRGWVSPGTLATALYSLRSLGFLKVTREGGLKQGTRVPTLYRFTDLEVFDHPKLGVTACKATHDYLNFKSLADARRALDTGVQQLREEGRKKQITKISPVRKTYRVGTINVLEGRKIATENVQGARSSVR